MTKQKMKSEFLKQNMKHLLSPIFQTGQYDVFFVTHYVFCFEQELNLLIKQMNRLINNNNRLQP